MHITALRDWSEWAPKLRVGVQVTHLWTPYSYAPVRKAVAGDRTKIRGGAAPGAWSMHASLQSR